MSKKHQNNAYSLVDEHTTTYENPFKFSAKELDDITGLYDHGARSRNPVSMLWYGVDPLWEQYPDFSPYNYCAENPVKLVDEDGRKHKKKQSNNHLGPMTSECRKSFKKSQKGKSYSPKQKPYKFVPITPGLGFAPNSKPVEDNSPKRKDNPEGREHPTGVGLGGYIKYLEFKYCGVENNKIKDDISKYISSILEENPSDIEYQVISLNKNESELSNTVKDAILSTDCNIEFKECDDIKKTDETKAQLSKEGEYEVIICISTIKIDE